MMLGDVIKSLRGYKNLQKASLLARYFKTGKGEYGEGDKFLGLTVPQVRSVAKKYKDLPLREVETLLHSPIHEYRLTALIILTYKKLTREIVDLYLRNTKYINNWDLVDLSSHEILGNYLLGKPRTVLYKLAKSKNIWERRIAVISTFAFLRRSDVTDSLKLASLLVADTHDLMHKAVGWMLREVGKRDLAAEETFLQRYYKHMPRTMLRYAIERFSPQKRAWYLKR